MGAARMLTRAALAARLGLAAGALASTAAAAQPASSQPASSQLAPARAAEACQTLGPSQAILALKLVAALADARGAQSVVVSPASLAAALDTLSLGADPALRTAILRTLGLAGEEAQFDCLRAARGGVAPEGGPARMADAAVFSRIAVPGAIRARLESSGTQVRADDLSRGEAVEGLNAWVARATGGLVRDLIDAPVAEPGLVVLDALHFKAPWATRFDRARTEPAAFALVGGDSLSVPMMHLPEGRYAFRQDERFVAVDLPFTPERYAMTLVTTRGQAAVASHFVEAAEWLAGEGFEEGRGTVALPRLALAGGGDLLPALDGLGLAPARTSPAALRDFSPGTTLTRVVQRVVLRADEDGAEAAAATAATATRAIAKPVAAVFDRPFVFALRDRETGLVLAAGYVARPAVE